MRRRRTARARLTTLGAVALLCYQVLAPLPALAVQAAPDTQSPTDGKGPGINELGYDPNWVLPAQPADVTIPDEAAGAAAIFDPSIGLRSLESTDGPPLVPTELPDKRTEHTRTIANPDGTFSLEVSQGRLNYQDDFGSWRPLDLSLVADRSGPYSLRVAANDRIVRFGYADAESGLAQLSADGHTIGLRAIGYEGGSRSDNVVTFAGKGSAGDVGIQPTDLGFEVSVTLDDPTRDGVYHFALNTGDLAPRLDSDGKTILLYTQPPSDYWPLTMLGGGHLAGVISAPAMLERSGERLDGDPVTVELTEPDSEDLPSDVPASAVSALSTTEVLVTYRIDPGWLRDEARQFPVRLDPTASLCIGGQSGCSGALTSFDEFIYSHTPGSHASGWTVVRTGYDNRVECCPAGLYDAMRGLFYFSDLTLPDGAIVTDGDLALTIDASYGNAVGKPLQAYRVNRAWATNSVSWNDMTVPTDGWDATPVSPTVNVPSGTNPTMTFVVDDIVRSWYTRRGADWKPDVGFMVRFVTESAATGETTFRKQTSSTQAHRPKLTITYDQPGVAIDFDPVLGNTYAPSAMVAGQVVKLPIIVTNDGDINFTVANWKLGYRFFDTKGALVGSGTQTLASAINAGTVSGLISFQVTPPGTPGQYTLRLDMVRVVGTTNLYASDWAQPSLYYSRNKKILTSDSTRWVGTSTIERDEFGIDVTSGAGSSGASQAVGGLSINLNSGNLHFAGDTGLGFSDLISPTLTYGYDKAYTTSCSGILAACGWFTNWDERLTGAGNNAFMYQDPAGNRYLASPTGDAQYASGAPVPITRSRLTAWDESNPGGWAGGTIPTVSTAFAYSGTHSLSIPASEVSTQANLSSEVDLLHFRHLNLWVKSSGTDKAAIGFRILDRDNPSSVNWFFYTFGGTSWTVPGFASKWINTSSALTSAGGYWLAQQNLWLDARTAISSLSKNVYFIKVDLRGTVGATGSLYYDALASVGMTTPNFNDSQPAWTSGTGNASLNTTDKVSGTASLQISPAGNPDCGGCNNLDLLQFPFIAWNWKKVGGSTIGHVFHFKDARDVTKTGDITYYAGSEPPAGAVNPVQVSSSLPSDWTYVQRNLLEDARQILGFYYDDPLGTDPAAPPSAPLPDPVTLTGFSLIAFDGSFALFDNEQHRSSSGVGSATAVADDDWLVTYPDDERHWFNLDGKLERITDRDTNTLDLVWTYDFAGAGATAYSLTTIRAPGDGLSLSAGTAQREIAVTSATAGGFKQTTFTEQLGSTSSFTGRRADFYVATSTGTTWGVGDVVKVSPARNNAATCGTRPNGCVEFAYTSTSSHFIDLVADPRWDGSTSGASDMRLDVTYDGSNRAYQILDRSNASVARLFVETFDSGAGGSYRRVLFQDSANRAANYATFLDLNPDGQPLITYVPQACVGTCSTSSGTWPTIGAKLREATFDGLAHVSQTINYRVGTGTAQREVSRQASNAGAKVDNLGDPLAAAQRAWTQTPDQYFASLADSSGTNPDLYRTEYTYDAKNRPLTVASPVANAHPHYAGVLKANSGQIGYWRLGETSGSTAADSSGMGNDAGISASGVTLNQTGALTGDPNRAMLLNGSTGRLTSAASLPQAAYTLEAWVNEQTAYGSGTSKGIAGDWASTGALLFLSSGTLAMVHGSTYLFSGIHLDVGRWYHVAGTWDGAAMRLYLDGELVAIKAITSAPGSGATAFEIGSHANGSGATFNNALIDEVGLWSTSLQPQRILSHYLAGRSISLPVQRTIYDAEGHPTEAATHFLLNGGFESGLAEWEPQGAAISTTTVKTGFVALSVTTTAFARQDAQLVPGQTIRFQFAAKTDGGGSTQATYTASYWQLSSQTWVNLVTASHTTSTWTTYAFDLTVPYDSDGRLRVLFSDGAASGTAYFDDALLVTTWSQASYGSSGLVTNTYSLQPGSSSAATLRTNLAYAAASTYPAIFPTSQTANYVNGVYSDTDRDEDLITTRAFDRWGRVTSLTDPDGVASTTAYATNLTDIASTADGLGNTTAYTYDLVGHPLTVSSPAGLVTTTTYDFLGNPLTVTAPDGIVGKNIYNSYGQRTASLANRVDDSPSGVSGIDDVKTTYTYDAFGRQLTSVADTGYSGSPDATTTLTYDQLGNVVTSAESGTGVTARTTTNYFATTSAGGLLYTRSVATGVRMPIAPPSSAPDCPGPVAADCTTVTQLDLNGRAIKVTDTYAKVTVTDYDLAGHSVRSIANYDDGVYSGGSPDTDIVSSAMYDIAGRLLSSATCGATCSGGDLRITKTAFDDVDRPIQQTAQMPAGTDYSFSKTVYLPSGRVERTSAPAATGSADSALTWTRTEYDAAGRAVRTLAHYDSAGNAHYRLDAFEDRNTTGWSSVASGFFTTAAAGSMGLDSDAHAMAPSSGAGRLRVTTHVTNGFDGAWWDLSGQTFQSGRTYHLHADLLATSGNTLQSFFGVDASGASYGSSGAISTTGAWQSLDINWTPSSGVSSNVHFALRKDSAGAIDAYLDNVQVYDTNQPDWNIPSETGYDADSQPIASVLPPGHAGESPLVTTTAYDPAGRAVSVSVNARTLYSHQIMADGAGNGLVAYFPLDERSGTSATDVKGGLNATYAGGYHLGVAGGVDESRTAISVDGASGAASRSANVSSATDNFSLEAWFRRDAAATNQVIVHNGTATTGWGLGLDASGNLAARYETTGWLSTSVSPSVGEWHHAVVVRSSGTTTIYLDGTAYTPSSPTATPSAPGAGFGIGRQAASTRLFAGAVDEVAVYTTALSSGAASAHYATGRDPSSDARLTTRSDYDALGRSTIETSARGIRTAFTYDRLGRTTATTANYRDGSGAGAATDDDLTATFAYDALGELLGSCSPRQVFATGCDPATPSNAQAWHFTYDAMGHQVSQTPPVNQTLTPLSSRSWTYDAGGRLTSVCDFAAGGSCASATRHTDPTYDGLGREQTRTVYSGSGTGTPKLAWTTTWNPDGSQASLAFDGTASAEGTDTLTFTYDGLGRPDQVKRSSTVLTDSAWDATGSLASRVDGSLGASFFGYDWANRLTSMTSPVYSGTLTFSWRLDKLLDGRQWPVGSSGAATFSYDGSKRPTVFAKGGSAASTFAQTYDRDGNVTSEGRNLTGVSGDAGTNSQSFTYDGANRVTAASGLTSSATYAYDRDANRTSATLGGATTTYAYDRSAELISRTDSGTTTYLAYDAYGNQTSSAPAVNANTASTYDLGDRLTSITPPASGPTTFTFDALGRSLTRVTPGGTDAFEYVDTSMAVWRITTAGIPTSSALDPSNARIATVQSGIVGYLLSDLHANQAAVVNAGETALLAATRYDTFGQTAAVYDSGAAFPTPWRFQGRLDVSPDNHPLYDFGARDYDPAIGAFTQLDTYAGSAGDPLSLNRFAYAEANPWTLIDPDGHMPLPCGGDCFDTTSSSPPPTKGHHKGFAPSLELDGAGTLAVIAKTTATNITGPEQQVRINYRVGQNYQTQVRSFLETRYDADLYDILEGKALRNLNRQVIYVNGRRSMPDFQIIDKASGRIAAVYEAKTGTITYLSGPGEAEQLFRYNSALESVGYDVPEVERIYEVRPSGSRPLTERLAERVGKAANVVFLISLVVGIWVDEQVQANHDADMRWLQEYDPDYYEQLSWMEACAQRLCG